MSIQNSYPEYFIIICWYASNEQTVMITLAVELAGVIRQRCLEYGFANQYVIMYVFRAHHEQPLLSCRHEKKSFWIFSQLSV